MPDLTTVFLFSGQGSQYYHMGKELYQRHPVFRQTLLELDEIAQSLLGSSVIDVLYHPQRKKTDVFDNTRYTHPAIYMVEVAMAQTLQHEGIQPDLVLGASMGAFAAATVAGAWQAEQALSAVIRQAEMVDHYCAAGHMLAILDDPDRYHECPELYTHSALAAVNFARHFVVSTDTAGLRSIDSALDADIVRQTVAVSHAFHSPWLDPAREAYLAYLQTQRLQPLKLPCLCSIEARTMTALSMPYFWRVVREPIHFQQTILSLEAQKSCRYLDLGPSGTLATFLKYLIAPDSASTINTIMTPYGHEYGRLQSFKEG